MAAPRPPENPAGPSGPPGPSGSHRRSNSPGPHSSPGSLGLPGPLGASVLPGPAGPLGPHRSSGPAGPPVRPGCLGSPGANVRLGPAPVPVAPVRPDALPRSGRPLARLIRVLAAGLLVLAACSRPAELPGRYFGLAFGDGPLADLVRQTVPLPDAVSEKLTYFTAPGRRETLWGVVLAEPVLAFYQGRFFSLDAAVADGAGVSELDARLTRDFGPPHCRESAGQTACLWQAGAVEMVLEGHPGGVARLMVRHGPTAAAVAAALPREAGNRPSEGSPGPADAGDVR